MIIREDQQNLIENSVPQSIIIEREPTASVKAISTNIVGVVATLTDGSYEELIDVGSLPEFVEKCGGYEKGSDGYMFAKNHFGRGGGALKFARVKPISGMVKAQVEIENEAEDETALILENKNYGTNGNNIIATVAKASTAGFYDISVRLGKKNKDYQYVTLDPDHERYFANLVNEDQDNFFAINDILDDSTLKEGVYQFSGGNNGVVATADDYVGVEGINGRTALQLFKEDDEVIMVVSAKVHDDINTALIEHVSDPQLTPRRTIITFPIGTSIANAKTKAQTIDNDKVKIIYLHGYVRNTFERQDELVSLIPFATAIDSAMSYEQSASQKVVSPTILKMERKLTPREVADLTKNQINPITNVKEAGIIFRSDYTTAKNPKKAQNAWRKAKDTISLSLDRVNRFYLSQDIDEDLYKAISDSYEAYFDTEWKSKRIGKLNGSRPYSVTISIDNNNTTNAENSEVVAEVEVSLKGLSDKIKVFLRTGVDISIINA